MSMSRADDHNAAPNHGRIIALDGFRGILALLVLFHHLLITQPDFANFEWSYGTTPARNALEWFFFFTPARLLWFGQERAFLFFVLSGYVLSLPWLKHRAPSYGDFLINRFCRIYAPYLIIMLLACAGAAALGHGELPGASIWFNQLGWSHTLTWRMVPSILLLLNNGSSNWVNESVWSLVWEVRVYLIFPLLILPVLRWGNRGAAALLAAFLLAQFAALHLIPAGITQHIGNPGAVFYYPVFFILGAAVALNQQHLKRILPRAPRLTGIAIVILALAICWVRWPVQSGLADGIAGALLIAAILGRTELQRVFEHKSLVWLGRNSYSLYLVHVPIILAAVALFRGHLPLLFILVLLPTCIGVAEIYYRLVEIPSSAFLHRLFGQPAKTRNVQQARMGEPSATHRFLPVIQQPPDKPT